MEIRQLEYFLAVAELGSFSKAAVRLSVAQPVLSRHVRTLEEEFGAELFYRNGRGVVETEIGAMVSEHARTIVSTAARIKGEMDQMIASPGGRLVLGLPPTASVILALPLVKRIREAFPNVQLKLQEGYSGHVLEWLSTGRIDVAILYDAPRTSTLVTQPLLEEELNLICPPRAPLAQAGRAVALAEVAELPLILPSSPHGLRRLIEAQFAKAGVEPYVTCEIESFASTLQLIEQGQGYTILPFASVRNQVREGKLSVAAIDSPRITRHLVLATSTQRPMTKVARTLANTVTELVKELVASGVWAPDKGEPTDGVRLVAAR